MNKIRRVLISVYEKQGIVEFAKALKQKFNVEILSTGGTGKLLEKNGIKITKISEYTGTQEMFEGRVKTLHPKVEGGILFRRYKDDDVKDAQKYNIPPIDMVVCNLYAFKEAIEKPNATLEYALEMIDIGGPTMIRAAAKNFPDVIVVPDSKYYNQILDELTEKDGTISKETRMALAKEVFMIMADYNAAIAQYLGSLLNDTVLPEKLIKSYQKVSETRYGENWDQQAAYYRDLNSKYGLHNLNQIHGKKISFNNYLDIDSCIQMLLDFGNEQFVTAILKHTSPNGIAIDKESQLTSVKKAFSTDPLSAFGGIWGFNKDLEIRSVLGGDLVQEYDSKPVIKEWKVVSEKNVTENEKEALIFAYKVSKWAKSNSACFAKTYDTGIYTIGIGAGQQSRVHVVKLAAQKAIEFGHKNELKGSVMGTDSFFPFPDGLEAAIEVGAKAIINPGGSIRDDQVIKRANELDTALIFCGKRVFRH
ncbi:MAG: bifunctional phosphoribosylaminoimidazolecarboxamide formyltransferase/IMP cyclohydrolase [Candidatus Lokiarchaeota archaeon]